MESIINMRKVFVSSIVILFVINCYGQKTIYYDDYYLNYIDQKGNVKPICSVDIPSFMKVISGEHIITDLDIDENGNKMFFKSGIRIHEVYGENIGFQEIPENTDIVKYRKVDGFDKNKAHVYFITSTGKKGEFNSLQDKLNYTDIVLNSLDQRAQTIVQEKFSKDLVKWNGLTILSINGISCENYSYELNHYDYYREKVIMVYNKYMFYNSDKSHTLTICYRQSDLAAWQPIEKRIINSLKFTTDKKWYFKKYQNPYNMIESN